jgi:hypothetical protein
MAAPSAPGLPPHLAEPGDGASRIPIEAGDGAEDLPLIIGYPVIPDTVQGQPVYAFLPSAPPPPPQWWRRGIRRRRSCFPASSSSSSLCCFLAFLLLLGGALAFFAWPRSIRTSSFDLDLQKIRFSVVKREDASVVSFYLDLDLSFQARNPNFLDFVYEDVVSTVSFQGAAIGDAQVSDGGSIDALDTSTVDASLEIDGYEISSNVSILISDIAKGSVPLRITVAFDGYIDLFLLQLPVEVGLLPFFSICILFRFRLPVGVGLSLLFFSYLSSSDSLLLCWNGFFFPLVTYGKKKSWH